jgi:hypothetical protein
VNPLVSLHGDLEMAKGRTLSEGQINRLWKRWSTTKRLPKWLTPTLRERISSLIDSEKRGSRE